MIHPVTRVSRAASQMEISMQTSALQTSPAPIDLLREALEDIEHSQAVVREEFKRLAPQIDAIQKQLEHVTKSLPDFEVTSVNVLNSTARLSLNDLFITAQTKANTDQSDSAMDTIGAERLGSSKVGALYSSKTGWSLYINFVEVPA